MNKIVCSICFSQTIESELKISFNSEEARYYRCRVCTVIFRVKKINVSYGNKYYIRSKRGMLKLFEDAYVYLSNLYKKFIVSRYVNSSKKEIKVLDIGSGKGDFLNILGKRFIKEGLEKEKSSILLPSGLRMHYSPLEKFNIKEKKYDMVTLWHVLEHFDDPSAALKLISKLLNKNGVLILSTPNTDSIGYRLAREKWYHFDFPYHKNLFNKKSLIYLAKNNDLTVKSFTYHPYEFPLDLMWSILKSKRGLSYLLLYPFAKLISHETIICVIQKNE